MKKILMFLLVAASLCVSSCSKNGSIVYEDIPATLYISNSGVVAVDDTTATYDIKIVKGGNADYVVDATIQTATQFIVSYNVQNNTSYTPLPEGYYTLSASSFSMPVEEYIYTVSVNFDYMSLDGLEPGKYALALAVDSENAYINNKKEYIMFCIEL